MNKKGFFFRGISKCRHNSDAVDSPPKLALEKKCFIFLHNFISVSGVLVYEPVPGVFCFYGNRKRVIVTRLWGSLVIASFLFWK